MLVERYTVDFVPGQTAFISQRCLVVGRRLSSSSSRHADQVVCLDALDVSSGSFIDGIQFLGAGEQQPSIDFFAASTSTIAAASRRGVFYLFDIDKRVSSVIGVKKLTSQVASVVPIRAKEGSFAVTFNGASSNFIAFIVSGQPLMSQLFRIDQCAEKLKGPITNLNSHPVKPYLIVSYASGPVIAWNYTVAMKGLESDGASGAASPTATSDPAEEDDNDMDSTERRPKRQNLAIVPVCAFMPPMNAKSTSTATFSATNVTIDSMGNFASVSWFDTATSSETMCVYALQPLNSLRAASAEFLRLTPVAGFHAHSVPSIDRVSFGPSSFHPHEPLLFQSVAGTDSTGKKVNRIVILSLLDPTLQVMDVHSVSGAVIGIDACGVSGRVAIRCQTDVMTQRDKKIRAAHSCTVFSLPSPKRWVSKVSISQDAYIDGDSVIKQTEKPPESGSGAARIFKPQQFWPSILCISASYAPTPDLAKTPLRPIQQKFDMYKMRIGMDAGGTSSKKAVTPLGVLAPPDSEYMSSRAAKWFLVINDDDIPFDGIFSPTTVQTNQLAAPCSDEVPWYALVQGTLRRHFKSVQTSENANDLQNVPCTAIIRFSTSPDPAVPGQSIIDANTVYSRFIAGSFWTRTGPVATADSNSTSILLLCANGRDLKHIPLSTAPLVGNQKQAPQTSMMCGTLPFQASRMWTPNIGCPNRVLFASDPAQGCAQELFLTNPGNVSIDLSTVDRFVLRDGERVVDAIWQPLPSCFGLRSSTASEEQRVLHQSWLPPSKAPLLGILTTHRVIIMSTSSLLSISSELYFMRSPLLTTPDPKVDAEYMNTVEVSNDLITSIAWVGSALCYVRESGAVEYLLPKSPIDCSASMPLVRHAFGVSSASGYITGHLFSLPKNKSVGLDLISFLPDRLLFAYSAFDPSALCMRVVVSQRPCLPFEPLMLSLLSVSKLHDSLSGGLQPSVEGLLKSLCVNYLPPKPVAGANSQSALPNTQASLYLTVALFDAGLEQFAALIAGMTDASSEAISTEFSRNRWIHPTLKFLIAIKLGLFSQGSLDLLVGRADLQELFSDPDSYGSGALPHRAAIISQRCTVASRLLSLCGQFDTSRRLSDIAGDDLFLAALIAADSVVDRKSALVTLCSACANYSNAYLHKILCAVLDSKPQINFDTVSAISIGGNHRRTNMVHGVQPPLQNASIVSKASSIKLSDLEKQIKNAAQARGGGLGPSTSNGSLAMDFLEDWMGRMNLAVLSGRDDGGFRSSAQTSAKGGQADSKGPQVSAVEQGRPSTWVEDIGQGKEWDKVVGYIRFSDAIYPSEPEFSNSGEPHCRINLLDLSKFSVPLELFSDAKPRCRFEVSTSAVDPGEDHEKVKSLNDMLLAGQKPSPDLNSVLWGVRSKVGRGSPLDVGMFHEDTHRNKFTFELMIYRMEEFAKDRAASSHCLAMRCAGGPTSTVSKKIWSISITNEGAVTFTLGTPAGSTNASSAHLNLATGVNVVNMGPTADLNVSVWTHIAVTIESGEQSSQGSTTTVSIYVNGQRLAKGVLAVPVWPETEIESSTLYLVPNLAGWRVSELRLWADCRSQSDLEAHKENYLSLASKRKRMQFRIKGSKKLFSALKAITIGDPVASIIVPTINADGEEDTGKSSTTGAKPFEAPKATFSAFDSAASSRGTSNEEKETDAGKTDAKRSSLLAPPSARGKLGAPPAGGGLSLPPPSRTKKSQGAEGEIAAPGTAPELSAPVEPVKAASSAPPAFEASFPDEAKPVVSSAKEDKKPDAVFDPFGSASSFGTQASIATPARFEYSVSECKSLSSAGMMASDFARCIRRSMVQNGGLMTIAGKEGASSVITVAHGSEHNILVSKFTMAADSAISYTNSGSGRRLLAMYANKMLSVFDISSASTAATAQEINPTSKVAELAMAMPLVHWSFHDESSIILCTSADVYMWPITGAVGSTRPRKVGTRIDVKDPERWSERKVLDVRIGGPGGAWVLVVSTLRVAPGGEALTYAQAAASCEVFVQHLQSGRGMSFAASGGCFDHDHASVFLTCTRSVDKPSFGCVNLDILPVIGTSKSAPLEVDATNAYLSWHVKADLQSRSWIPMPIAPGAYAFSSASKDKVRFIMPSGWCCVCDTKSGSIVQTISVADEPIVGAASLSRASNDAVVALTSKGRIFEI